MNRGKFGGLWVFLALAAWTFITCNRAAANGGVRAVAISGQPAPDTAPPVTFNAYATIDDIPVINDSGQVAFVRHLAGTGGVSSDSGIWSEGGGGGLALVTREGTSIAPGTAVGFFDFYSEQVLLNNAGQTAVYAYLDTSQPSVDSSNFNGIWSEGHGSGLALIARAGSPAPGTSGNFEDFFDNLVFNDQGQTAFTSVLAQSNINLPVTHGVWTEGHGGGLALLAKSGDVAPGSAAGATFDGFDRLVINNGGQTAFYGHLSLSSPGVNLTNDDGIWKEGGSGLTLVAREGNPAPGVSSGVVFAGFSSNGPLAINSQGRTAFIGALSGPGVIRILI